jgi:hypothetical protein
MLDVDRCDPTSPSCLHRLADEVEQDPGGQVREVEAEEADLANGRYPMRRLFFSDQGSPTWFCPPAVNGRRRLRRFSIRESAP